MINYPNKNNVFSNHNSTWTMSSDDNHDSAWTKYTSIDEIYADASSKWWLELKEFENVMPELGKVELMCKDYPALKKAFENFKMVYNLVKDDYEAKHG